MPVEIFRVENMEIKPGEEIAAIALSTAVEELNHQVRAGLKVPVRIGRPHHPGGKFDEGIMDLVEHQLGFRYVAASLYPSHIEDGDITKIAYAFRQGSRELTFAVEEFTPSTGASAEPMVVYSVAA